MNKGEEKLYNHPLRGKSIIYLHLKYYIMVVVMVLFKLFNWPATAEKTTPTR